MHPKALIKIGPDGESLKGGLTLGFNPQLRSDPDHRGALIYMERQDVEQAALHFYAALETDPNDRDAELWLNRIRSGEVGKTLPPEG